MKHYHGNIKIQVSEFRTIICIILGIWILFFILTSAPLFGVFGQFGLILANMMTRVLDATDRYVEANCDTKGNIIQQNVDRDIQAGIRSIQERSKAGELFCCATDKSGRLSVTSLVLAAVGS